MNIESFENAVISDHAASQMARRGIDAVVIRDVLRRPAQVVKIREGRIVCQSQVVRGGRTFLVRVVVDVEESSARVVTAYQTSKIEKYWRRK